MEKLPLFEEKKKKNKKNTVQDLIFCVLQVIGNIHKFLIPSKKILLSTFVKTWLWNKHIIQIQLKGCTVWTKGFQLCIRAQVIKGNIKCLIFLIFFFFSSLYKFEFTREYLMLSCLEDIWIELNHNHLYVSWCIWHLPLQAQHYVYVSSSQILHNVRIKNT